MSIKNAIELFPQSFEGSRPKIPFGHRTIQPILPICYVSVFSWRNFIMQNITADGKMWLATDLLNVKPWIFLFHVWQEKSGSSQSNDKWKAVILTVNMEFSAWSSCVLRSQPESSSGAFWRKTLIFTKSQNGYILGYPFHYSFPTRNTAVEWLDFPDVRR